MKIRMDGVGKVGSGQIVGVGALLMAVIALAGCEGGCRRPSEPGTGARRDVKRAEPSNPPVQGTPAAQDSAAKSQPTSSPTETPIAPEKDDSPKKPTPGGAGAAEPAQSSSPPAGGETAPPVRVTDPKLTLPKEGAEIERISRDLSGLWESIYTFSADVETDMQRAFEGAGHTKGLGHYDYLRAPADRPKIRFGMRNGIAFQMNDEHFIAPEMVNWVTDGEFLYQETKQPDVHRVDKRRYDPSFVLQLGGRDLWDRLREENVLSLREESKLDGRDVYVIDATAKDGGIRSVHKFDKVTGARLEWDEYGDDSKPVFHVKLFNVSLTPQFPTGHFTFTMPEGATLHDETK